MRRYSTETGDLFENTRLEEPRYVPKAGGNYDLLRGSESPQDGQGPSGGPATPPTHPIEEDEATGAAQEGGPDLFAPHERTAE